MANDRESSWVYWVAKLRLTRQLDILILSNNAHSPSSVGKLCWVFINNKVKMLFTTIHTVWLDCVDWNWCHSVSFWNKVFPEGSEGVCFSLERLFTRFLLSLRTFLGCFYNYVFTEFYADFGELLLVSLQ